MDQDWLLGVRHGTCHLEFLFVDVTMEPEPDDVLEPFCKRAISCSKLVLRSARLFMAHYVREASIRLDLEELILKPLYLIARIRPLVDKPVVVQLCSIGVE